MIKIWRSWKSAFGEFSREFIPEQEESWNVTDIYTDGELERIRRAGFNAVWVHAQLNHIVRTGYGCVGSNDKGGDEAGFGEILRVHLFNQYVSQWPAPLQFHKSGAA